MPEQSAVDAVRGTSPRMWGEHSRTVYRVAAVLAAIENGESFRDAVSRGISGKKEV